MKAEKAFVEKTLTHSKNKNSLQKSDILNTFGAFSVITAGVIAAITITTSAALSSIKLLPTALILGSAFATGGYIGAGHLFGQKVEKFRKNAAIAAVILTSATLTPISAIAINNKEFQNGLIKDLNKLEEDIKSNFNKSSADRYSYNDNNIVIATPNRNKAKANVHIPPRSY